MASCECNGTSKSRKSLECYIKAKDLIPSCKPILRATVKPRCGPRRMLISTIILMLVLALAYFLSTSTERLRALSRSLRSLPQVQPRTIEAPETSPPPPPPPSEEEAEAAA